MNTSQSKAATSSANRILVLAGPGSGKTTTLCGRINHLVNAGAAPSSIVAVTFTNAAAGEMRKRLAGVPVGFIGTLHALALRNIKRTLLPDRQRDKLLESEAKRQGYKGSTKALHDARETFFKDRLSINRTSVGKLDPAVRACATFYAAISADGLADCDSLLWDFAAHVALHALHGLPGVAHILGDEFQDSGDADALIYSNLSVRTAVKSIFLVGDPDQAIYGFRGGNVGHIVAMATGARPGSGWELHVLDVNYRSSVAVCRAASALMRAEPARPPKDCVPLPGATAGCVTFKLERSMQDHNARIAEFAATFHNGGELPFSELAVLTRTNADADDIAAALRAKGFPVARASGKFSGHAGTSIRADNARLLAGLWTSPDNETLGQLWCLTKEKPDVVSAMVREFRARKVALRMIWMPKPPETVAEAITNARTVLDVATGDWVQDLAGLLDPGAGISDLVAAIARTEPEFDTSGMSDEDRNGIRVGTIHWSKGQEFRSVIVAAFEERDKLGFSSKEPTAEDRRLYFVALTRAKETAHFVASEQRFFEWAGNVRMRLHRFAADMQAGAR